MQMLLRNFFYCILHYLSSARSVFFSTKKEKLILIFLLRPYVLYFLYFVYILIILIFLKMTNFVYAMEDGNHNQIVNDLILAKENQNPIELNRLLEQLRSISDRERLLEISQILHQLALERGIDFDYINIGNNTITIANEGAQPPRWTYRSALQAIGLLVTFGFIGYVIYRNIDIIRDLFFDLGTHAIDLVPQLIFERVTYIINTDPEGARILFIRLLQLGLLTQGHDLPLPPPSA
jgi:hypothetical protein